MNTRSFSMDFFLVTAASLSLLTVGCSGDTAPSKGTAKQDAKPAVAKANAAPAAKVANPGSVAGRVVFKGDPPSPRKLNMNADPYCAEANGDGAFRRNVTVGDDGGLAGVFVYAKSGVKGAYTSPTEKVVLDQQNCNYDPGIIGAMVGQPIEIRNSDMTLHNVHAMPKNSGGFNMGMPTKGMKSTRKFTAAEVLVRIKCDVHPWMETFVGVTEHPFYAVTGEDGAFSIKGLAPGSYVFEAVHPKLGSQEATVKVAAGGEATAAFAFEKN